MLSTLETDHQVTVTLEDGILDGGFGQKVADFYGPSSMLVKCYGLEKKFADRYRLDDLLEACRLKPDLIAEDVLALLR